MRFKIIILIVVFSGNIFCQENIGTIPHNNLNLNIGIDIAKGFRIGLSSILSEHFSLDVDLGQDIRNFISLSDPNTRLSFSANWHKGATSNLVMGFSYSYIYAQNKISDTFILSANIGSLSIKNEGFDTFYRFGLLFYDRSNVQGTGHDSYFFPNFDLGIRFNLF